MNTIWLFMLIMNLLIPITMVGFGAYFSKYAPKNINYLFGYRTRRSMINDDTWKFAHNHIGKIWFIYGWIVLAVTIIFMVLIYNKSVYMISVVGIIITLVQTILLVCSIFPTEKALKKTFDYDGKRLK